MAENITNFTKKSGKKHSPKHRGSMRIVLVLLVLVVAVIGFRTWQYRSAMADLEEQRDELTEEIADAQSEQDEIEAESEYRSSIQYIEDLAREKFGLIFDNEILFKKK